jgi:hypothetical protein
VIYRNTGESRAELLYSATQYVIRQLSGTAHYQPPLTWTCQQCGQQVTDRAPAGRPVNVEHGHGHGCARLARDQAAEDQQRREHVPGLILDSEPAAGLVQRHWLREPITDDCPRCGRHGYFHYYIGTIDGDWANAVCDDCYVNPHADITVTVRFYAAPVPASLPRGGEAVAVIRQRDRSDHDYPGIGHFPDTGQKMNRRLWWEHLDARRGRPRQQRLLPHPDQPRQAESIVAGLAARTDARHRPAALGYLRLSPIGELRATACFHMNSICIARRNGPTCMSLSRFRR